MKSIYRLLALSVLFFVGGCGYGERDIIVENCGEPIEITDCHWRGQLFHCDIKNMTDTVYPGIPVWLYDLQGEAIEFEPYRYAVGLKPGDVVRQKLPITKYNEPVAGKVVFCSSDPAQKQ